MQLNKIKAAIEAILFSIGESVHINKLSEALELDKETTKKILANLMDEYDNDDRGISIIEIDNCYQMCTKSDCYEYIRKVHTKTKHFTLTDVLVETLSIIAYKQPITKAHIEGIRGVRSDHAVNKLVEYNLVCEVGRLDAPGKPILFGTTQEFLRTFGLKSIDELPIVDDNQISILKNEVEEEVQLKLVE